MRKISRNLHNTFILHFLQKLFPSAATQFSEFQKAVEKFLEPFFLVVFFFMSVTVCTLFLYHCPHKISFICMETRIIQHKVSVFGRTVDHYAQSYSQFAQLSLIDHYSIRDPICVHILLEFLSVTSFRLQCTSLYLSLFMFGVSKLN